jgi:competence protein ComEC
LQKIQEFIADNIVPEIAAQKSRLFLWSPVCFAIGIAIYFGLKSEPYIWSGALLSIFLGSLCGLLGRTQEDSVFRKVTFLCMVGVFLALLGFTAAQFRAHSVYTPMLLKKISPVGVEGYIDTIEPLGEGKGSRAVLKDVTIERLSVEEIPRKIRLTIRKDEGLKAGQRIKILAGLNPASPPVAPGAFDFQRMAYFKGLGAVGFAYTAPEILEEAPESLFNLRNIRQILSEKISTQTSEPQQSVIIALMTGQRGAISDKHWRALRESGLAHLLAISGLHVGMVAGVIFFFSRLLMACSARLALHYPIKKYAAAIALSGAFFYTIMVGATVPTQRALMMTGLVMVAIMMDRSPFSLRLVALAALVVLFFSPESLTSVSFQMSFAAVAALICFYEWLRPYWSSLNRKTGIIRRVVLYFAGVSLTTLVAGFATGLFALFHFQNYAMYGLLANVVAVPLMALIVMPVIVLSYVLMPFDLEGLTLPFVEWGVGWILATAHFVSKLEGAVWLVPSWPHWIFISMVLCLWTMMIWKGRLKVFLIPPFILLISFILIYKQPDILISSKVDLVSLRSNDGSLWLSTGRKERYTAKNWLRRNGQKENDKHIWPREGEVDGFPLSCDSYGCRGEIQGQKISVAYSNKAWREDCDWADVIISQTPIPYKECRAETVIDYFDLWRESGYALWLTSSKIKVKSVETVRGKRLWAQTSANKKLQEK